MASGNHILAARLRRFQTYEEKLHSKSDDDELNDFLSTVSEAEALLACRSYLQSKNRLDKRTDSKATWLEILEEAKESDSVGFFWENPDELVNYDRKRRPRYAPILKDGPKLESDDESTPSMAMLPKSSFGTRRRQRRRPHNDDLMGLDVVDITEDETTSATYFRIDEETPSKSHIRRSEALKKRFADPAWKAAWYEKRWGKHRKDTVKEKKERLMHQRVLPLAALLSHPELAAMSEEEIAQAIRIYRDANIKRSVGVRKATERRRTESNFSAGTPFDLNTTVLERDSLFRIEEETLQQLREKRAETAKRAYQTRLKIEKSQKGALDSTPFKAKGRAPDLAMQRIHNCLHDPIVSISSVSRVRKLRDDLRRVMMPTRLSRRKFVLHRMLRELFDMRGKCVPDGEGGFIFVTDAPIQDVAKLIDKKLYERIEELTD